MLATGVLLGCGERAPIAGPSSSQLGADDVVGAAAAALDKTGHFILPAPHQTSLPEISASTASALAVGFIAEYGRFLKPYFEEHHGSRIDLTSLEPCGRVMYAATAYEMLLPQASRSLERVLGPHWLVTLCSGKGDPSVSVAVSALAADVHTGAGVRRLVGEGPNDFFAVGIPAAAAELPGSPEEAVKVAARAVGRRVSEVPELVLRGPSYAPQLAQWKITVDADVSVRGTASGAVTTTRTIFVGPSNGIKSKLEAFAAAPSPSTARAILDPGLASASRTLLLTPSRSDLPASTERFLLEAKP